MKTLVYSRLKAKNHEKNCYEALVAALAHTASPCVCACVGDNTRTCVPRSSSASRVSPGNGEISANLTTLKTVARR